MSFLDTALINDHDVRALSYLRIVGHMDLLAPGDRRGSSDVVYGLDGERGAPLPLAKFIIRIPIQITGATRGERNDNLRALGPLICGTTTGALVTIKRRLATGSGDEYDEASVPGQFITGLTPQLLNSRTGRTELQYYGLSGYWLGVGGDHQIP